MKDLRQLFATRSEEELAASTEIDLAVQSVQEIKEGYKDLLRGLLQDGGVNLEVAQVEVRDAGRASDGKHVFLGMLRIARWERKSALRLMLGLPLMERLLRRVLRGSWLSDVSHFGGLWLHPASGMIDANVMRELRELLQTVEQLDSGTPSQPPRESMWSVPVELEQDPPTPPAP